MEARMQSAERKNEQRRGGSRAGKMRADCRPDARPVAGRMKRQAGRIEGSAGQRGAPENAPRFRSRPAQQNGESRNGRQGTPPVADRQACLCRRAGARREWSKFQPSATPHDAPTPRGLTLAVEAGRKAGGRNQADEQRCGEIGGNRKEREGGRHWAGSTCGPKTSGRKSCLETFVTLSTSSTLETGTVRHCETACDVTPPIARASADGPPAISLARRHASSMSELKAYLSICCKHLFR